MTRSWIPVAGLAVVVPFGVPQAGGPPARQAFAREAETVTVMTRNVYLGADLSGAMGALIYDPGSVPAAVAGAWAQVQATDFEVRAGALADEIAQKQPALVGLQEVAIWRSQFPADSSSDRPRRARTVEYDFLKILRRALRERGLRYRVAAVAKGVDIELPRLREDGLEDIRFTDRDVILARRGVKASMRRAGNFEAAMELPVGDGIPVPRSWASVESKAGGRKFRFVTTHLEDGVEEIQRAQVAELLAGPLATDLPVVLVGDFNSDPDNDFSPLVHGDVTAAGFADAWGEVHPSDPGRTWGHAPLLDNETTAFTYRLDYVFRRGEGVTAAGADLVGEDPADRVGGLWPSDHAGVAVEVRFGGP